MKKYSVNGVTVIIQPRKVTGVRTYVKTRGGRLEIHQTQNGHKCVHTLKSEGSGIGWYEDNDRAILSHMKYKKGEMLYF